MRTEPLSSPQLRAPEQCVRLEFRTLNQVKKAGFADFEAYVESQDAGIPLNDPHTANAVLAELRIFKTMPDGAGMASGD